MPKKHKRRGTAPSEAFDLPPSKRAKPLPVGITPASKPITKPSRTVSSKPSCKPARKSEGKYRADDTPKAFARLMNLGKTGRGVKGGLDNGKPERAKRPPKEDVQKAIDTTATSETPNPEASLRILPGERMAQFSARVDQALPLSGLAKKAKKVEGVKERRSKLERKMRKKREAWLREEERLRGKEEEEREREEEEWEEKVAGMGKEEREVMMLGMRANKKRKGRRGAVIGEIEDGDDDPWEVLRERDRPMPLHYAVKEPPKFGSLPREVLKDGARVGVVNVPKEVGSLKRREDLGEARMEIIRKYRAMMAEKRS